MELRKLFLRIRALLGGRRATLLVPLEGFPSWVQLELEFVRMPRRGKKP